MLRVKIAVPKPKMIPCSRFTRFRFGSGGTSYQTSFVAIAILTYMCSTATAPQTDSPVHYFTWSGFPVLSFREADNFVTESPTQYSPKLFHFPVPFTFNGKPALVVHMNKATAEAKARLNNTSDVTSSNTSYTPVPINTSVLPTSILSPSSTNEGSTSTSKFGFMPYYPSAERPNTYKSSATQTRISSDGLKLHKTFVGNGRPHSFFIIKAPGRRINEFKRRSQRRRNKPKTNVRRSL